MAEFPQFSEEYRRHFTENGMWLGRTLGDYFSETVARAPDKVAIVAGDRRITFAQWADEAERLAAGLVGLGITKGDIVSVQLPNWPEMCVLQVALARIGAVMQPMHMVYRQREMASMLRFCESRAVLLPATYGGFDSAGALAEIRRDLPNLEFTIVVRGAHDDWPRYDDLIASRDGLGAYEAAHPILADDIFYLNFTSGTEGEPKGFLHTHNTILSAFKRMSDLIAMVRGESAGAEVILCNSPMSHSYGHFSTYHVVIRGIRVVLAERYSPAETLKLIERERVTSMSGTPAHLIGLLNHPDFGKYDLSSLASVSVGGALCPVPLVTEIQEKLHCTPANTYGMGENLVHTMTMPWDPPEVISGTVGHTAPGAELKIFNDDHATELPTGEIGEIAFRGPTLFVGYFKQPQLTAKTRNPEGWFFTGDLGWVDGQGYLHLAGRKKELINRGGTKIYPKEVEDLLHAHPKVVAAAVIGMPDYRLGEKLCAYLVLKSGATVSFEEIKQFLESQQVMKLKIPERIEVVDALPMTPTGKVKKDPLVEDIRRKLAAESET